MSVCFLWKDRKGVDMGGEGGKEGLKGEEGGVTVIRTHYIKIDFKFLFNLSGRLNEFLYFPDELCFLPRP